MSIEVINPYKTFIPQLKDNVEVPLSTVIKEFNEYATNNVNCVKIGTIKAFDPLTQTATILIAFKKILYVNSRSLDVNGNPLQEFVDYPLLVNCPIFTYTGGQSYINMPVTIEDSCLVLFNDMDIDNWFNQGNGQILNTYRTHDISDGFAIVGFRNNLNKISDFLSSGIKIQYNTANRIEMTDSLTESFVELFHHTGDMKITGNLEVTGNITVGGYITAVGDITAGYGTTNITLLGHKHINGGGVGNSGTPTA